MVDGLVCFTDLHSNCIFVPVHRQTLLSTVPKGVTRQVWELEGDDVTPIEENTSLYIPSEQSNGIESKQNTLAIHNYFKLHSF